MIDLNNALEEAHAEMLWFLFLLYMTLAMLEMYPDKNIHVIIFSINH